MKANKIKVNIAGNSYTIIGQKAEQEVFEIAKFVDNQISEISKQNYRLNSTMAVTLVALNIASDFFDIKKELAMISKNSNYPVEKQEKLIKEKDEIENEKNSLRKEIEELKNQNSSLIETLKNIEKNSIEIFNEVKLKNNMIIKLKDDIIKIKDEYIKQLNKK